MSLTFGQNGTGSWNCKKFYFINFKINIHNGNGKQFGSSLVEIGQGIDIMHSAKSHHFKSTESLRRV